MRLQGEVLKRFRDVKNGGMMYAPEGTKDIQEYTNEETTYPHIFVADKERYEELEAKGYVGKGGMVNEKKSYKIEEE
ncbi:MAG: hypothetical protein UHK60_11065 [Acutalibacteraceae bacterium]|nr:hypothetical protein [Acutalibacteraceae bacterium]